MTLCHTNQLTCFVICDDLIACISKKIILSQSNCSIRFFLFQSLVLVKIGTWMLRKGITWMSWWASPQAVFRNEKDWLLLLWCLVLNLGCLRATFFKPPIQARRAKIQTLSFVLGSCLLWYLGYVSLKKFSFLVQLFALVIFSIAVSRLFVRFLSLFCAL